MKYPKRQNNKNPNVQKETMWENRGWAKKSSSLQVVLENIEYLNTHLCPLKRWKKMEPGSSDSNFDAKNKVAAIWWIDNRVVSI